MPDPPRPIEEKGRPAELDIRNRWVDWLAPLNGFDCPQEIDSCHGSLMATEENSPEALSIRA